MTQCEIPLRRYGPCLHDQANSSKGVPPLPFLLEKEFRHTTIAGHPPGIILNIGFLYSDAPEGCPRISFSLWKREVLFQGNRNP